MSKVSTGLDTEAWQREGAAGSRTTLGVILWSFWNLLSPLVGLLRGKRDEERF